MLLQGPEGGRQFDEGGAVPQSTRFALNDRQIVPPVVDRLALTVMGAGKDAGVLTDSLPLCHNNNAVRVDPQTDRSIGEGRRNAVAVALQMNEAGWRDALAILDEAVEGARRGHQMPHFL